MGNRVTLLNELTIDTNVMVSVNTHETKMIDVQRTRDAYYLSNFVSAIRRRIHWL